MKNRYKIDVNNNSSLAESYPFAIYVTVHRKILPSYWERITYFKTFKEAEEYVKFISNLPVRY